MSPLNKKLFRDLWRLRMQVMAVALVVGSGVATLVMALSTIEALEKTSAAYYQEYRFADVFARLTRAPERLKQEIRRIPGVKMVETRISRYATLDIDGFQEPVIGQLLSIPETRQPYLNQLVLRKGSWIAPGREEQIIVSETFAEAQNLEPGDTISIIMNGSKREFTIVGIALSPEFIYSIGPGSLVPDNQRFGVIWMGRKALESAYDLEDAFNDVTLSLSYNAQLEPVLNKLDQLLEPYGGVSAIDREDQISNWFVMNEIEQQKSMGTILPGIFILVAVFLSNMVLSRLIATERTEIGLLKAFGYSNWETAWHYLKMVLIITILGIVLGSLLGSFFGRLNTELYADFFRFPLLIYQPGLGNYAIGGAVSLVAAVAGTIGAVWQVVKLPPAEAMTPPAPAVYRRSIFSKLGIIKLIDQPTRIALRQIARWPVRSSLTSLGIAASIALVIMALQWSDSLDRLARSYFFEAQRQDIMVGLVEKEKLRAIHDFEQLPGVLKAEPMRFISADFRYQGVEHRGAINAILPNNSLYPIYDDDSRETQTVPSHGLAIANRLATKLGVVVGDELEVAILQGRRPTLLLPIVATFESHIGLPVFMELRHASRLLKEAPTFDYANLLVDPNQERELLAFLKDTPVVSAIMLKQTALDSFHETISKNIMVFNTIFSVLAAVLAFGVTYNSTRIALSERGRELATLRVLGFSKGEISYVLLGEVMFLIFVALPLGCLLGYGLVWSMASAFDTEMFRVPIAIQPNTYGYAIVIVLVAAAISAALVRKRVDELDLIRVLKTRE